MKKVGILLLLTIVLSLNIFSHGKPELKLLKPYKAWRYEIIPFPIEFAPEIELQGFEELLFSPEMFKKDSPFYFTYVFALKVENQKKYEKKDIKDFLEKYYNGLSKAVAQGKNAEIDLDKISVENMKYDKKQGIYTCVVRTFDCFTDCGLIDIKMKIKVEKEKEGEWNVFFQASPSSDKLVWEELNQVLKL